MGVWSFGGNTPCDRPRAESCNAVGGTWDLFRYPGICSDSDMYTFGYSFRPWELDPAIADGESIRRTFARPRRPTASTARSASSIG